MRDSCPGSLDKMRRWRLILALEPTGATGADRGRAAAGRSPPGRGSGQSAISRACDHFCRV